MCPFCGKRYTSRSGLLSHKNTVHYQRKPYRCQLCNEHFFTSAQRVAHIHKEHADKGEDITDTYSRKDTVMRKKTSSATEEDTDVGEEQSKTPPPLPPPKKAVVSLLPKILPSSQDIRYYKVPHSSQQRVEGLQLQKAYSLVAADKTVMYPRHTPAQEHEIIISEPKPQPPLQMPKFVVLPAKQPYTIVQKPREAGPNKTYSRKDLVGQFLARKDQQENVSIYILNQRFILLIKSGFSVTAVLDPSHHHEETRDRRTHQDRDQPEQGRRQSRQQQRRRERGERAAAATAAPL